MLFLEKLGMMTRQYLKKKRKYTLSEYNVLAERFFKWKEEIAVDMEKLGLPQWDIDEFRKTTRAMGVMTPTHFPTDERKELTEPGSKIPFPESCMNRAAAQLKKYARPRGDRYKMSLPRGRFMGWPFTMPGSSRMLSNLAALSIYFLKETLHLSRLEDFVNVIRGIAGSDIINIGGERGQHTGPKRLTPAFLKNGKIANSLAEARRRLMIMVSKVCIIFNRLISKYMLRDVVMMHPLFLTDTKKIAAKVQSWKKRRMQIIPLDQKGYDLHMGSVKLKALIYNVLPHFLTPDEVDNVWYEASRPIYLQEGRIDSSVPQLPSGMSFTTVLGCIGSLCGILEAIEKLGLDPDRIGKDWDALIWGDDVLLALVTPVKKPDLAKIYEAMGLEIDFEDKIKFLGFIYDDDYMGYPVHRIFQGIFPERLNHPDLLSMGLVSKLMLYNIPNKLPVAQCICKWMEIVHGPRYKFNAHELLKPWDQNIYVKRGIARAQKVATDAGALDDILFSMGRGFDTDEGYALFGIPDDARGWVAPTSLVNELPSQLREEVKKDPLRVMQRIINEEITETSLNELLTELEEVELSQ